MASHSLLQHISPKEKQKNSWNETIHKKIVFVPLYQTSIMAVGAKHDIVYAFASVTLKDPYLQMNLFVSHIIAH